MSVGKYFQSQLRIWVVVLLGGEMETSVGAEKRSEWKVDGFTKKIPSLKLGWK